MEQIEKHLFIVMDGGSTKCSLALCGAKRYVMREFAGVNPVYLSKEQIISDFALHFPKDLDSSVPLFYYGAGCTGEAAERMREALEHVTRSRSVFVGTDMLGAARGLWGDDRGVACILGTGSNSAAYDGRAIVCNVAPLGYILGDEGGAADIGKAVVSATLKGLLGEQTKQELLGFCGLTYHGLLNRVYREPAANLFLASFSKFASARITTNEQIRKIVSDRFNAFVERNLLLYPQEYLDEGVGFVGSVAEAYNEILQDALKRHGLEIRRIVRKPLDEMVRYHYSHME